jgi:hypothetical protein
MDRVANLNDKRITLKGITDLKAKVEADRHKGDFFDSLAEPVFNAKL